MSTQAVLAHCIGSDTGSLFIFIEHGEKWKMLHGFNETIRPLVEKRSFPTGYPNICIQM